MALADAEAKASDAARHHTTLSSEDALYREHLRQLLGHVIRQREVLETQHAHFKLVLDGDLTSLKKQHDMKYVCLTRITYANLHASHTIKRPPNLPLAASYLSTPPHATQHTTHYTHHHSGTFLTARR
jgi:hypothetical protein